jgi:hypothetical protein
MFNYNDAALNAKIPQDVVAKFEEEARREFPWDEMLIELHILRAVHAYSANAKRVVTN